MQVDLFAGIPVRDYDDSLAWYRRLLGAEPSFLPHATEAVWELAEHCFLFIVEIQAAQWETYPNGVRKATYRDPDGNEIGFGGASVAP